MKSRRLTILSFLLTATLVATAAGWPSRYTGVMLQGFYWDSYDDTQWSKFIEQADELSESFDLIWIPNSAESSFGGLNQYTGEYGRTMGYMPVYWFSHYTTCFGTEADLRKMIQEFGSRGTGFVADVVINHRAGQTDWYDFPRETWRGKEYHIGLDGITGNDELAYNNEGKPKPTGANDEGDNFDGARDLDHTNANVQDNVKAYCDFLLQDLGYAGFRYDMVKGYKPYYIGMYNQWSMPRFSVGEYWDSNYDNVTHWIDETNLYGSSEGNQQPIRSAAFDFPLKDQLNAAFSGTWDMSKLSWERAGTGNWQPAGLIHNDTYNRYSITFIDNHDTYRTDEGAHYNFSADRVEAANAFILMSPGTPCVFLPHWKQHKEAIKRLIKIRKEFGIHNQSRVEVMYHNTDRYMAKVHGLYGTVVVKIGWNQEDIPADLKSKGYVVLTSGTDYCVWGIQHDEDYTPDSPVLDLPERDKVEIFVEKPAEWNRIALYAWNPDNESQLYCGNWPGKALTETVEYDGRTWYRYVIDSPRANIIFNNNNQGRQTDDLKGITGRVFYTVTNRDVASDNTHAYCYTDHYDCENPEGYTRVFVKHGWAGINAYAFNEQGEIGAMWPGRPSTETVELDGEEYSVFRYWSDKSVSLVFNNIGFGATGVRQQAPGQEMQTLDVGHLTGDVVLEIKTTTEENGKHQVEFKELPTNLPTGIETVKTEPEPYTVSGRTLTAGEGMELSVYTVSGMKVGSGKRVSLEGLDRGIYVVVTTDRQGNMQARKLAL